MHSHEKHLYAFLDLCRKQHFTQVYIHAFLDGRDTPPRSALDSIAKLEHYLHTHRVQGKPVAYLASMAGRYESMDRSKRFDLTQRTYDMLTQAVPKTASSPTEAIQALYQEGRSDEFFPSTHFKGPPISDNDIVFSMNFRADRIVQLTKAFTESSFTEFTRVKTPKIDRFISMMLYSKHLNTQCAFIRDVPKAPLAAIFAEYDYLQLRLAELEKFPHVTYFFNGGIEEAFPGEERLLIPALKGITTYDLAPEMNASRVTEELVKAILAKRHHIIICNLANPDMVGHTGNMQAAILAVEHIDRCLREILSAIQSVNGEAFVSADHGNVEKMFDELTQQAHTAHTFSKVPAIYFGKNPWRFNTHTGSITGLAPTMLQLCELPIPEEMDRPLLTWKKNVPPTWRTDPKFFGSKIEKPAPANEHATTEHSRLLR